MEMAQLQQSAVHNHTAAMLEMGTNLLSQTAEQTRKLTDVETQVTTPPLNSDSNEPAKVTEDWPETAMAILLAQLCFRLFWGNLGGLTGVGKGAVG